MSSFATTNSLEVSHLLDESEYAPLRMRAAVFLSLAEETDSLLLSAMLGIGPEYDKVVSVRSRVEERIRHAERKSGVYS